MGDALSDTGGEIDCIDNGHVGHVISALGSGSLIGRDGVDDSIELVVIRFDTPTVCVRDTPSITTVTL
jgi:hypothetical protein